ncbi:MAG TPA: GNAT family N-acetyltransferase [Candidatus Binatia bacterium]|jgi:hypothetical protein
MARALAPSGATLDGEGLARFYRHSGVRVAKSESSWWYQAAPRFLLAIPTHRPLSLAPQEASALIRREKLAGLRYMATDSDGGRDSYQIVCDMADYSIEKLSANTRSRVRRGLSRNEIRRISGRELISIAGSAFVETMQRQNRASAAAVEAWKRMLAAADEEPAVEIWTAWHEGAFASYLVTVRIDDTCEFFQARSSNSMLKHYPNNALIHTLTEEMLVKRGVREVTFGIESPEPLDELDTFKLQMGFRKKPVRQRVVFHPALRLALAVAPLRRLLVAAGSRPAADVRLRKAAGILKFAGNEW